MNIESYLKTINKDNFKKPKVREKYEKVIKYLFANKFGSFSEIDTKFIISYIVKDMITPSEIKGGLKVQIKNKDDENTFWDGCFAFNILAKDEIPKITYSKKTVDSIMSNDYNLIVSGITTIYHELIHFYQHEVLINDYLLYKNYIMAMETITRIADAEFYKKNYSCLLKEIHAEKFGLKYTLELLKKYRKDIYDKYPEKYVAQICKEYDERFFKSQLVTFEETGDSIKQIDKVTAMYVEKNPEILEIYPILRVAYNGDGTRKKLKMLLIERENILNNPKEMIYKNTDETNVNATYRTVINERYFDIDEELGIITDYIHETKQMDEFVYDILKYRLDKKGFSKENQDLLINSIEGYIAENSKSNVK